MATTASGLAITTRCPPLSRSAWRRSTRAIATARRREWRAGRIFRITPYSLGIFNTVTILISVMYRTQSSRLQPKTVQLCGGSSLSSNGAVLDAQAHDRTGARLAFYMQLCIDQPGTLGHALQAVRVPGPGGGHVEASSVIA